MAESDVPPGVYIDRWYGRKYIVEEDRVGWEKKAGFIDWKPLEEALPYLNGAWDQGGLVPMDQGPERGVRETLAESGFPQGSHEERAAMVQEPEPEPTVKSTLSEAGYPTGDPRERREMLGKDPLPPMDEAEGEWGDEPAESAAKKAVRKHSPEKDDTAFTAPVSENDRVSGDSKPLYGKLSPVVDPLGWDQWRADVAKRAFGAGKKS